MKYTITINQAVLAETSLDLLDAAILDYLYVYCNSLNEKIEAQRIRDETGTAGSPKFGGKSQIALSSGHA